MLERFSYYLKQIVFNGEIAPVTKKDQAEKKDNTHTHTGTMLCFALLNIDFSEEEEEKDDFGFPKQTWSFLLLLN